MQYNTDQALFTPTTP